MSKSCMLELPETLYATLARVAADEGVSPRDWIAARLPALDEEAPAVVSIRDQVSPVLLPILERVAAQMGQDLDTFLVDWKRKYGAKPPVVLTDEEREMWNARLQACIIHTGCATGTDNESIDADLVREYGDDHADLYRHDGSAG